MDKKPAISVRNLSKQFRLFSTQRDRLAEALHPLRKKYHTPFWALRDVSFEVSCGEVFGVLGQNGSGKSTLLQIVCGVMRPSEGSIEANGRISALLELGAGFNPEFTGRENVILNGAIHGFSRQEMLERIDDVEAFADIGNFFDQPIKLYSSGMFVRVAFAAAIHVDPEILIVDEALSVGDAKFQHRCFQRIRHFMEMGKTILVVSHSTDTLLRICTRGMLLEHGEVTALGDITTAVNRYHKLLFGTPSLRTVSNCPDTPDSTTVTETDQLSAPPKVPASNHQDRIVENPFYNPHEVRMGSGKARIMDCTLLVNGESNPPVVRQHAPCELTLWIHCEEETSLSVGFAIISLDGTYVMGTNLSMMGYPLVTMKPGESVAVKFHWRAHIAGGEYFLNLGCDEFVNGESCFVDVRRSVLHLRFADTPYTTGFADLGVRPEVFKMGSTDGDA